MELITSRAVLGEMKRALSAGAPPSWVGRVANLFESDQASEDYPWLTTTPAMREWVGGRNAKGFTENNITIRNRHFEDTVQVLKKDLRRDKFGMLQMRIAELTRRAMAHPGTLLSSLILNGGTNLCYDGKAFFATNHAEGDSGTQSNKIDVNISDLGTIAHGIVTSPGVEEMQFAIGAAVQAMVGFKDDAGEPMNEDAAGFLVMVPPSLMQAGVQACRTPQQLAASQSVLSDMDFSVICAPNARLSSWTDTFAVFRTDSYIKPLIFQRETAINVSAKAEGSDYEHDNDAHEYGVDYWGNVAYGLWQHAVQVRMI